MPVLMLQHVSSRVAGFCGACRRSVYGGSCKTFPCRRFHSKFAVSFCVAGVALRDIPTCFKTCHKPFCIAGALQICFAFFVAGAALWTPRMSFCVAVAAAALSTSRAACFTNRIVSAAQSGDKLQIPWLGWHFVTGDEKWWKRPHRF